MEDCCTFTRGAPCFWVDTVVFSIGRTAEVTLPETRSSAAAARQWLRDVVADDVSTQVLDDVVLVASELVTNAIVHAHSGVHVLVGPWNGGLQLEVTDGGPGMPSLPASTSTGVGGRGLRIVDDVTSAWGVRSSPTSKTVWARFTR